MALLERKYSAIWVPNADYVVADPVYVAWNSAYYKII